MLLNWQVQISLQDTHQFNFLKISTLLFKMYLRLFFLLLRIQDKDETEMKIMKADYRTLKVSQGHKRKFKWGFEIIEKFSRQWQCGNLTGNRIMKKLNLKFKIFFVYLQYLWKEAVFNFSKFFFLMVVDHCFSEKFRRAWILGSFYHLPHFPLENQSEWEVLHC